MAQLPSVKKIDQDLTTSSTWEDADGATIDLTVDDQSDILLIATIQASGSVSAEGGWRLVFDGTNYLQSLRQVDSEPANITLVDLVPNKGAGTYTFKLQHQIASGTLTTGVMLVAVSLHNGSGAVPANSAYVASDTVGNAWEDIPGLTCDVTLSKTSHIWAMMVFHGYHSGNNKRGTFAINIDATRMEENVRDWGPSNEQGAVAIATRTDSEKTAGTYTVKGEWIGMGGTTLTGEDFSLVVIAAEADGGNASIDIQKDVVASDTTTSTTIEDITGSGVTAVLDETAHVLGVLTLSTDSSVNNTSAYCTIRIDGTDYGVMERGHAVQQRSGSIGHAVRTTTALSSGSKVLTGRWYTDSGNTLTGEVIILTSIVLAAESVVGIGAPEFMAAIRPGIQRAPQVSLMAYRQEEVLVQEWVWPGERYTKQHTSFYDRSLAGSLSFGGALTRKTSASMAGGLSFLGALTKKTTRTLTGALSFLGDLVALEVLGVAKRMAAIRPGIDRIPLIVALADRLERNGQERWPRHLFGFQRAVAQVIPLSVAGTLSFLGTLVKKTSKPVTGVLSFTGALTRRTRKALAGSLTLSGVLGRKVLKQLAGTLTFAGQLTRKTSITLSGVLTFAGDLVAGIFDPGVSIPVAIRKGLETLSQRKGGDSGTIKGR